MKHSEQDLISAYIHKHPDAAARELEQQPIDIASDLIQHLPLKQAQSIIEQMMPYLAARFIGVFPEAFSIDLLTNADARKVVAILRCLSNEVRTDILKNLPDRRAIVCRFLLSYPEDTIGAWMVPGILMLPSSINAGEALNRLMNSESDSDSNAIPIVDDTGRPIGLVSAKRLLNVPKDTGIRQLARVPCPTLPSRIHLAAAMNQSLWTAHSTVVVLDRYQIAIGAIRHLDLRCALANSAPAMKLSYPVSSWPLADMGPMYAECLGALLDLVAPRHTVPTPLNASV